MSNAYVRLSRMKTVLGQLQAQGGDHTSGGYNPRLVEMAHEVSREWDRETHGMHLYSLVQTRYFGQHYNAPRPQRLWVVPLISITSVSYDDDGDYSYGETLTEGTDFWVERDPDDPGGPIWSLWVHPESLKLSRWPCRERSIRIAGVWGYSNEVEATGQTVANTTQIAADGTVLEVARDHGLDPGETLVIEDEQVAVTGVGAAGNATQVVIQRGLNGTTAAAHANGTAIYRRVYPADAVGACQTRLRVMWHAEFGGGATGNDIQWTGQGNYELTPAWVKSLRKFQIRNVGSAPMGGVA